jgi:tetratricopeptide (TPR) repeat protein
VIAQNDLLRSISGLFRIWSGDVDQAGLMNGTYRPIFLSVLSFTGRIFSFYPGVLRTLTILLHALTATLIWKLGTRIFRLSSIASGGCALLFLIHPLQVTNLALVWKQSDVWIALFSLLSILCLSRPWISVGLFVMGLGFKESTLILPAMWFLTEPLWENGERRKRFAAIFASLCIGALYYKLILVRQPVTGLEDVPNPASPFQNFYTQLSVLPLYLGNWLYPLNLTIDRNVNLAPPLSGIQITLVCILIAAFVGLVFLNYRLRSRALAAGLLAAAWLIPTSTFKPLALLYDETRMYLAVGFLLIGLTIVLQRFKNRITISTRWLAASFTLLTVIFVSISNLHARQWKTEETLWTSALEVDPNSVRAHLFLGNKALEDKALDEAEIEYRAAFKYAPTFPPPALQLGLVLGMRGKLEEAAYWFSTLLDKGPYWEAQGHYHLGLNAMYRREFDLARSHFKKSQIAFPSLNLGAKGEALLVTSPNVR